MKKFLLVVMFVAFAGVAFAQQEKMSVVKLKNGIEVRGVIVELVDGVSVTIKNNDGVFFYNMREVANIDDKNPNKEQPAEKVVAPKMKVAKAKASWKPHYKGEVNLGFAITGSKFDFAIDGGESWEEKTNFSRPLFETVHGVEIGSYFFVGAGLGLQYYCGKMDDLYNIAVNADYINGGNGDVDESVRWNTLMMPIFANVKFMYPVNDKFTPFLSFSIGGTAGLYSPVNCDGSIEGVSLTQKVRGGLYCDLGVGFRYKVLNLSLGWQYQGLNLLQDYKYQDPYGYYGETYTAFTKTNAFYLKVGVNF